MSEEKEVRIPKKALRYILEELEKIKERLKP